MSTNEPAANDPAANEAAANEAAANEPVANEPTAKAPPNMVDARTRTELFRWDIINCVSANCEDFTELYTNLTRLMDLYKTDSSSNASSGGSERDSISASGGSDNFHECETDDDRKRKADDNDTTAAKAVDSKRGKWSFSLHFPSPLSYLFGSKKASANVSSNSAPSSTRVPDSGVASAEGPGDTPNNGVDLSDEQRQAANGMAVGRCKCNLTEKECQELIKMSFHRDMEPNTKCKPVILFTKIETGTLKNHYLYTKVDSKGKCTKKIVDSKFTVTMHNPDRVMRIIKKKNETGLGYEEAAKAIGEKATCVGKFKFPPKEKEEKA